MTDSIRSSVLAGLKTALEAIQTDTTYPIHIKVVSEFEENLTTRHAEESVLLMVIDDGPETIQARDSTHYRYAAPILFRGYVQTATSSELTVTLNNMLAAIKKFLDATAGSTIHSACKAIHYVEGDEINYDKEREPRAEVLIRAQLIYVCTAGSF